MKDTSSSSRIPSLDGLRALSIFLVMIGHFASSNGAPFQKSWLTDAYAHFGVCIFFIISGFLITTLLTRERKKTGTINLKQFYIRRAYRLLPVAYLYLIFITVVFHKYFTHQQMLVAFAYLSSYVKLPWSLSHLWSLSVEEQFYFVWPMILTFGFFSPKRFAFITILLSPICRFVLTKKGMYYGAAFFLPSVADSLAFGCLLSLYQNELRQYDRFFRWKGFPAIWAFALAIPVTFILPDQHHMRFFFLPQLLSHAAITVFNILIALCIQNAIVTQPRIFNFRIVAWIGTLSYSLYIWEMPFANPQTHSWATTFPLNIVLAFLAAIVSYYAVESPFLKLRRRFSAEDGASKKVPALSLSPG
jgi:peptidoglycan/LPS O-acetylase OafA/YrhL